MLFGNPTKEMRYTLGYFILFIIGVGSAGLHGTLHWVFQSSDGEFGLTISSALLGRFLKSDGRRRRKKLLIILFFCSRGCK